MKTLSLFATILLMAVSVSAQQVARSADDILADAYKDAAANNKNVLVLFHASWCGWCHKMDNALNDSSCKKLFDANYVIVHLTVSESDENKPLENPGAVDIIMKYNAQDAGLPFWLVLDKTGNLLADSRIRPKGATLDYPGENMGCPATEEQVSAFIKILKHTSTLTDKELKIIATRFRKNAGNN
jgi:thiol-disulfide isomerase/thioredoxin